MNRPAIRPVEKDDAVTRLCPIHAKPMDKVTLRCLLCTEFNEKNGGRRKAQPKREKFEDNGVEKYTYVGSFNAEDFGKYMERLSKDPARYYAAVGDSRRPRGVNRVRYGVAVRASLREPMLTADPKAVRDALATTDNSNKGKLPKDKVYRTVTVKPQCLGAARNAGSWKEQTWTVWTLKYTSGLVIVTESGEESCIYPGWNSMMQNILNAGWEIVR